MELIISFILNVVIAYFVAQLLQSWLIDVLPSKWANASKFIAYGAAIAIVYFLAPTIKSLIVAPLTSLLTGSAA